MTFLFTNAQIVLRLLSSSSVSIAIERWYHAGVHVDPRSEIVISRVCFYLYRGPVLREYAYTLMRS